MNEKVYKVMGSTGAGSLALGIIVLVCQEITSVFYHNPPVFFKCEKRLLFCVMVQLSKKMRRKTL